MESHEIDKTENSFPKEKRNKLIYSIGLMIFLNLALNSLIPEGGEGQNLDGSLASPKELNQARISTILFGLVVIGFFAGLIVSFLPYKNLSYADKYLPASLLTILVIHVVVFLLLAFILIMS